MKLKYRLRNFFFPRKHSEEVRAIYWCQLKLKYIRNEIAKLDELSQFGILGDSLWKKEYMLFCNQTYYERKIAKLKRQFKQAMEDES
ncbi:MAG: hypothetical protein Q4A15_13005 [Prevotellaceae bacterium]|nr:hypothetical protein [Prevotellaceae bacterium]